MTINPTKPEVQCLLAGNWPSEDRALWQTIITPAYILDAQGEGAHWRPATKLKLERNYGRWIDFLARTDRLVGDCAPQLRASRANVDLYLHELQRDCASRTVLAHIAGLRVVLSCMAPEENWTWLADLERRLRNAAQPIWDVTGRLQPSDRLFDAGLRYLNDAMRRPPHLKLDHSSRYRDGLMIALLAARPIRMRNLTMITLGQHLLRSGEQFLLCFTADEHKVKRPLEFPVPDELTEPLDRYLQVHRPLLLQGHESDRLWISNLGRAMTAPSISHRIRIVTNRLFGCEMNPHSFRHSVASTIAEKDPAHVGIIRSILGHATLESSNRNYNKARAAVATRQFAQAISTLRRQKQSGP